MCRTAIHYCVTLQPKKILNMDTLYIGIGYAVELNFLTDEEESVSSVDYIAALRHPASGTSIVMSLTEDVDDEKVIVASLTAAQTLELPVGNYNLEVYTQGATEMVEFRENFVRAIESSGDGESSPSPAPSRPSSITDEDIEDLIDGLSAYASSDEEESTSETSSSEEEEENGTE